MTASFLNGFKNVCSDACHIGIKTIIAFSCIEGTRIRRVHLISSMLFSFSPYSLLSMIGGGRLNTYVV